MPVRILIADDHHLIRSGIRAICGTSSTLEVCGESVDGEETLKKVQELKPDVVILDVRMPKVDAVNAASQIRKLAPETKILMISGYSPQEMEGLALRAGAHAFVSKDEVPKLLGDLVGMLTSRNVA
jgi:DNA-binding NarL/FixJ family response regulator